jgi:hypothetical protein
MMPFEEEVAATLPSDGTVTNGKWKCKVLFTGPLDPACQASALGKKP